MVLFIVVIVETFVHVQHKSNSYWIIADSYMTRGLKNFAQRQGRPYFTEKPLSFISPVSFSDGESFPGQIIS
jgi:hypothetical protein